MIKIEFLGDVNDWQPDLQQMNYHHFHHFNTWDEAAQFMRENA